jgi:hypothetical protein
MDTWIFDRWRASGPHPIVKFWEARTRELAARGWYEYTRTQPTVFEELGYYRGNLVSRQQAEAHMKPGAE